MPEEDERWRSQSVMLQVHVLIQLETTDGRLLRQDAFTYIINSKGCLLTMENKPEVGQRMVLINPNSRMKQSGIVTRAEKSREAGYVVAFEFDNPNPQLWSLEFCAKGEKLERL